MTHGTRHPADLKRVTPESVSGVLAAAGAAHGRVVTVRPGVVRVDVYALSPAQRRERQRAVVVALDAQRDTDFWEVHPLDVTYRWRPWRTWVTVRDPGLEWVDPATGLDFIALLAHRSPA